MYPDEIVQPMREELTRLGIQEARTAQEVDAALGDKKGTALVIVNSVCGCAAGKARPGVAAALQHEVRPDRAVTVFAGADIDATAAARAHFAPYPPSSPQIALFKNGRLVYMMERHQIETRTAEQIEHELKQAFALHCTPATTATA